CACCRIAITKWSPPACASKRAIRTRSDTPPSTRRFVRAQAERTQRPTSVAARRRAPAGLRPSSLRFGRLLGHGPARCIEAAHLEHERARRLAVLAHVDLDPARLLEHREERLVVADEQRGFAG